jgi:hypothetical protein
VGEIVTPRLVIATPIRAGEIHSASVSLGYAEMLTRLHRYLPVEVLAGSLTFATDIVRAHEDVTHVLWVDDDQWCDDVAIVSEMLALGLDVVGAPYTNKRMPTRWVHQRLFSNPPPQGDLLEVAGVGFGFTLTSVAALRKMSQEAQVYTDHPHSDRVANIFGHLFYHPAQDAGNVVDQEDLALLSEDFSFCLRWRRMGGRVYIYAKAGIIHHAGPHDWTARGMPGGVVAG